MNSEKVICPSLLLSAAAKSRSAGKAVVWTCDQCLRESIQTLKTELQSLRREIAAAQIELGRRQDVEE